MPQWKDMAPEEQEARREAARARTKALWDSGKFGPRKEERARARGSTSESGSQLPPIPKGPKAGSSKDSIAAIGNLVWLGMSFPVGLFSPPAGTVMQAQIPTAGKHIDKLLADTRIHELLAGGDSEKGQAALLLFGPPAVAVIGGIIHQMGTRDPDNPRIVMFEAMLEQLVAQLLHYQGIRMPQAPPRTAAPRPAPAEVSPSPAEEPGPVVPPPVRSQNGWGSQVDDTSPVEVAAAAATASRFDHVE